MCLTLVLFAQEEKKEIIALRINEPVVVDGYLNESAWKRAPEAGEFILFKSERNKFGAANTSTKILYDSEFLYIGFLCQDPEPDKIEARTNKKDEDLRDEDSVYILISTVYDLDHFYYFGTNLLGAQWDGKLAIDTDAMDSSWNGVWKSTAQKTDSGWSAEIAIDLASLGYKPKEEKNLNLSLSRIAPRMLEGSFWRGPLDPAFDIVQLGQLKSIDLVREEKKMRISPHLLASAEEGEKSWLEWGLDLRLNPSQLISGHLALNPDFATVEPDEERINLTRFELYLPEKRSFLLEGSEIYNQPIRLFYSKRIPDIYGGIKFNGRSGRLEFSGMSILSRRDQSSGEDPANFSVVYFKKKGMKSSISFLAANKFVNEKNSGAAGFDSSFSFSEALRVAAQFAASYGDNSQADYAFFLCPSYNSKTLHFHLSYSQLGKNFGDNLNKVGFLQDDNRREMDAGITKDFLISNSSIEQIQYELNYNIYWGTSGALRSWQVDQGLTLDLKSQYSLIVQHSQEFKAKDDLLFEKNFRNYITRFGFGLNTKQWQYATLFLSFGHNFGQSFSMLEIGKNLQFTQSLAVEAKLARIYFGSGRAARNQFVLMLKTNCYLTRDLLLKIFYQSNTLIDKSNIELLLSYRFLPPSGSIQLAYQMGRGRFGEKGTRGNTLLLNINYRF